MSESIMAGQSPHKHIPIQMVIHQQSKKLTLVFEGEASLDVAFELLRVYSPSAQVKGHGPGQEILQVGKRDVVITSIEPVGHYGIKPVFSDGHDTGIYTWDYLYTLGQDQDRLWTDYLARLQQAGAGRD